MLAVVLDSQAMSILSDRRHKKQRHIVRYLEAARRLSRPVILPTVVLAELYRGPGHNALVDACLAREEEALTLRDTDRAFARLVGSVLSAVGKTSEHLADAHVVAAAVEAGGGVIATSDRTDIEPLARPYRFITVDGV